MSTVPLIPDTAPFTPDQRAWLNGFFAGLFSRGPQTLDPRSQTHSAAAASAALQPLTILFGSQTGTAETLAKKAAKEAGKRGFAATIVDMAQVDLARLAGETNLLIITSTYGDGEPPDNAKALHEALRAAANASEPVASLAKLRFSICALGDTNYTQFCQCGKDFDTWLERLGATRATPRTDCDVDYDDPYTKWLDEALAALARSDKGPVTSDQPKLDAPTNPAAGEIINHISSIINPTEPASAYTKKNPFPAPVLTVRNLNGAGSAKEVNHVEFSLEGSGLTYEAGDALGVFPQNCPALVDDVLAALGCDGEEEVPGADGKPVSLRRALTESYDLGKPSPDLVALLAPVSATARGDKSAPAPAPHHIIDLLHTAKIESSNSKIPTPSEFVAKLKKIQPRLYSISSSPRAHPGQVHLTVGAVRYDHAGRARKGVCSTFLAERALAVGRAGVFVHANKAFRPPADGATPMIMVGPGTGIAPFRAFLEERRATGATGRNWLFFGDQRESTDFLYREELLAYRAGGLLTRLDLAWSRDQSVKVYVQNRMLENAAELFAWLEVGAHFYVCGDASRMAKDVDAALKRVIETAGGRSPGDAAAYVDALRAAKRYQRDVY